MTTFKDERVHKLFVATTAFPGCGECSVVYAGEPTATVLVKRHLKQPVLLQTDACESEEG